MRLLACRAFQWPPWNVRQRVSQAKFAPALHRPRSLARPLHISAPTFRVKRAMASGNIHADGLRIAIEGCGHGMLNVMYDAIRKASEENDFVVDLLIICGDFQAVRNLTDLEIMSCPPKYRQLGDFHEYYSGKQVAPVPTLFIGGNHESSSYMSELYHGGWVAPNIYYMGAASVVQIGNLRIGGLTGIYTPHDYPKPHHERLPYQPRDIKSIYHVRQYDVFKLFQISSQVDVMLSHDWPTGVEFHGDYELLFKRKPYFKTESLRGDLGSPAADSLLKKLKPRFWFSGHMHTKFSALVDHEKPVPFVPGRKSAPAMEASQPNPDEVDLDLEEDTQEGGVSVRDGNPDEVELDLDSEMTNAEETTQAPEDAQHGGVSTGTDNPDEVDLGLDSEVEEGDIPDAAPKAPGAPEGAAASKETAAPTTVPSNTELKTPSSTISNRYTRFLALNKCLPSYDYMQILTVDFPRPLSPGQERTSFSYDPEWLSIVRVLNRYPGNDNASVRKLQDLDLQELQITIAKEREWVEENIVAQGKLAIPKNFEITAPVNLESSKVEGQPTEYRNNQTREFCELLQIEDWVSGTEEDYKKRMAEYRPPPPEYFQRRGAGGGGGGGGGGRGGRGGRGRGGRGRGRGGGRGGRGGGH